MKFIFYSSDIEGKGKTLFDSIASIVPISKLECYNSIEKLSKHLSKPTKDSTFILLSASNMSELVELYSLKNLLDGLQLILVIPNMKAETIKYGYLFFPRYLDFLDSDFVNLRIYIKNLLASSLKVNHNELAQRQITSLLEMYFKTLNL